MSATVRKINPIAFPRGVEVTFADEPVDHLLYRGVIWFVPDAEGALQPVDSSLWAQSRLAKRGATYVTTDVLVKRAREHIVTYLSKGGSL